MCEQGFITSESSTVKHQRFICRVMCGTGKCPEALTLLGFGVAKGEKIGDGCREIWSCYVFCVEELVGFSGGIWF